MTGLRSLAGLGWCLVVAVGCQSASKTQPGDGDAGSASSAGDTGTPSAGDGGMSSSGDGGTSSVADVGGSSTGEGGASPGGQGGTVDAGGDGQGGAGHRGGSSGSGGGTVVEPEFSLTSVEARRSGLLGADLTITVAGEGDADVFSSISVEMLGAGSTDVLFFDSDWDGNKDSAEGRAVPLTPPTGTSFESTAVVADAGRLLDLSVVEVALVDNRGQISNSRKAVVAPYPRRDLGEECDDTLATDYCSQGYSCSGAVCVAGTPPTIDRGVYQEALGGTVTLLEGSDREADVIMVRLDFMDEHDDPVKLDLNFDDEPESTYFEAEGGIGSTPGGFTFRIEGTDTFADEVAVLGLTAIDSQGNESETMRLPRTARINRSSGQSCDLGGFDSCEDGTTCVANTARTSGTCTTAVSARRNRCSAGPSIDPSSGATRVTGWMTGISYWEPPETCIGVSRLEYPEAVVRVHLAQAVSRLTLSTAEPETNVDTVLFVADDCDYLADSLLVLGCNDDSVSYTSELVLTDLAKGDYFVVIESGDLRGGSFGLSVVAE